MFLFTLLGQKIWQNFPSIIIIWCWFSQTFLSSSHFRTVFGETKIWQTFLRNLNATILQKSSQVRLYFKLYANINSYKISQCYTILKQDLIECKALVSNYHNTPNKVLKPNLFAFNEFRFLSQFIFTILSLLNLHFSCSLVAFIAPLFGPTGASFPGCRAEGLSVKPKRWNMKQKLCPGSNSRRK